MRPKHLEQFKEEYQEKGYCQIREFFSASEIKRIEETLESAKDKSEVSKEKVTLKIGKDDNIDTKDHAYDLVKYDFVSSLIKRKLPFLNYITGKKIMIMHNAFFSVEPNRKGLGWHVGVGSFSFTQMDDFGASIWIPLDQITKEYRGGMQYVPTNIFPGKILYTINDLHLKNNIKWDESQGDLNEYVANANTIMNKITEDVIDYTIGDGYEEDEYKTGDVLLFNKYVLHRSVPLKPGLHKLRRAFVIRLVDYDTRVDEERLGLFSTYSQLHSRFYNTLPRYNKDSVLVMVSRSIKQGLKSPYLRDVPYVQKTLSDRIADESEDLESENILEGQNALKLDKFDVNFAGIKETLKQSLADALYADISEIEEDKKFVELGLDSIVGVEWITSINKIYNLNIKATKVYDYPTLLDLAKHISEIKSSHNGSSLSQGDQITSKESPKNQDLSIDPQEDVRQKVRSILSQVANKKLTAQEANKIIAKIKQGG
ncbi:MAG: phosphopantetheine-binding protein [Trichodesmium sp. St19_bin1]|nr:phosphopantetheine-binding protein [Trichodesmium sp. St19_bin1]